MEPDSINGSFVPRAKSGLVSLDIDLEAVLVDPESGRIHALNPTSAVIWDCFDGTTPLAQIATDLARDLDLPPDDVHDDVLAVARSAGHAGLLDGVAPLQATPGVPLGLPVGTAIGIPPSEQDRALIINWNPTCGFCERILPELSALRLPEHGVEVILVAGADGQAVEAQIERNAFKAGVMWGPAADKLIGEAFAGMGTPAAYLVDSHSRITAPVAYGAPKVVDVARDAARGSSGARHRDDGVTLPRFLPVENGVCGPGAATFHARDWRPASGYEIGPYTVGIRANNATGERLLHETLGEYRLDATPAPPNFSVVISDNETRGKRDLNLLLAGTGVVARSRSSLRILQALSAHLGCLLDPPEGLLRLDAAAGVSHGQAMLLPKALLSNLARVQGPLSSLGVTLVDGPFVHVDPDASELVVLDPRAGLAGLPSSIFSDSTVTPSEPAAVPPARYPLRSWFFPARLDGAAMSPAGVIAQALGVVVADPAEVGAELPAIAALVSRLRIVSGSTSTPEDLIRAIQHEREIIKSAGR